jgi:hypothetical protein
MDALVCPDNDSDRHAEGGTIAKAANARLSV